MNSWHFVPYGFSFPESLAFPRLPVSYVMENPGFRFPHTWRVGGPILLMVKILHYP